MDYIVLSIGLTAGTGAGAVICWFCVQASSAKKIADKDQEISGLNRQMEQSRIAQAIVEQARDQFVETAKAAVSSQSLQTNSENFLRRV